MQLQAFIFCGGGHNLVPFSSSTLGEFSQDVQDKNSSDTANNGNANNNNISNNNTSNTNGNDNTQSTIDTNGKNDPMTAESTDPVETNSNEDLILSTGHLPKALLPVANRPMIEYVIDWCDQANFSEIFIVAHRDEINIIKDGIATFLNLRLEQLKLIEKGLMANIHTHFMQKITKVNFISSMARTMGETLMDELLPLIKSDFVLLPCDFITDIPPQIFINQYQNRDDDNLAMTIFYKNSMDSTLDKKNFKNQQFFTVYSDNLENNDKQPVLLDLYSMDNVKRTKYLQIRSHLLWKYPNTTVSTKLFNSSIYFCSFELINFLTKPRLDLEQSVINNLNNFQINSDASTTNSADSNNSKNHNTNNITNHYNNEKFNIYPSFFKHHSNKLIPDPIFTKTSLTKLFRDLARRSWRHASDNRETIGIFILPDPKLATFIRANNLSTYMDSNRFILKIKSTTSTLMQSSSAIGADSVVDPSVTLGEKSSIKLSSIKSNCIIGNKCRISGSVLLNGATVADDVILENVIVGPNAVIKKKCKLTNCYVEGNYIVEAKSVIKGETLKNEIYDDEDDEDYYEGEFDEEGYAVYNNDKDDNIDHLSSDAIDSTDGDDEDADDYYQYGDEEEDDGLFER